MTPVSTLAAFTTAMPLRPDASSFWNVSSAVCSSKTLMTGADPRCVSPTVLDRTSVISSCACATPPSQRTRTR